MRRYAQRMGCTSIAHTCGKGWGGYPRCQIGDLEGGGYPRCQIGDLEGGGCASIHDVEIWVSGWGGKSGGKVTRSQLPVGCRIDDLDDPRSQPPRGVSGVAQTGVSVVVQTGGVCRGSNWGVWGGSNWGCPQSVCGVCRNSKTARNAATCALGIAPSEPVNPAPSCGFGHRNP